MGFPILFLLALVLQAPSGAGIEGIVTKAGTSEPVPRASIVVTMIQGQLGDVQTAVADDNGRFAIRNLTPGSHRVFPAATVVLVPNAERRRRFELYRTATTDSSGRASLTRIAPGAYKLFAWQDIELNAWQNAEALRPFEEFGVAVTVGENGKVHQEITIIE